jgi:hypothetical protein
MEKKGFQRRRKEPHKWRRSPSKPKKRREEVATQPPYPSSTSHPFATIHPMT